MDELRRIFALADRGYSYEAASRMAQENKTTAEAEYNGYNNYESASYVNEYAPEYAYEHVYA